MKYCNILSGWPMGALPRNGVRHSHGLMKHLGMLPTPATGSATGGSPADGTAR